MNPSELKANVENTGSYFFTRQTMKFFGDTMKNYGVCSAIIDTYTREKVECWELYRKRPVKHGLQTSAHFDKKTFEKISIKI